MTKASKNTQNRENFHPVQNVQFRFVWFNGKIRCSLWKANVFLLKSILLLPANYTD